MDYGVTMFPTDYAVRPDDLARLLQERGFESVWFPEHTHIPVSRRTPYPGGGELPKEYSHSYDPFVALTAAAAATTNLKLGTGVCLVIERDPIVTAKEIASLDFLSGGRFLFGIGGGWNIEEMADHGTDFKKRWRVLRERVLAMKALWTQDEADFHGEFVNFDKTWSFPKPAQKPHPPLLIGGDGPTTFDRVIEFGDGWMPIGRPTPDGRSIEEKIKALHGRAREAGRSPDSIPLTIFGSRPEKDAVDRYEQAGARRVIFSVPPAGREIVEPLLDRIARTVM
jgi:probable F420-dependent oxidoreductase